MPFNCQMFGIKTVLVNISSHYVLGLTDAIASLILLLIYQTAPPKYFAWTLLSECLCIADVGQGAKVGAGVTQGSASDLA